ncbi:sensor histidine kinase [Paenibacillus alba]|uniref:Histidine kinase n=1 Tax=Paenibacillus alba TaxID=1197127 RepID=A0ABU6G8X6_9BACL|nr:histidine kinase [Paenibacillus alba]MEC0230065.1 histidine kinase [Paenibacillus alba]
MKWIRSWYFGPKSVQRRLFFLLVTVFIPLTLVLFFVYRFTEMTLVSKVGEINRYRTEQSSSRVEDLFQRIFMATNLFINDKQFLRALQIIDPYDIDKNTVYLDTIERLQYVYFLNEKYAVFLRDNHDNMYADTSRLGLQKDQLQERVFEVMDWKETDIFNSFKWSTLSIQGARSSPDRFIVFTRWLFNPETALQEGMITIVMPISYLQDIFKNDDGYYVMTDENGDFVFSTRPDEDQAARNWINNDDAHRVKQLSLSNWVLYQLYSNNLLNNQLKLFNSVVILTVAVFLIIYTAIVIVVLRTTGTILNQIRTLSKQLASNSPILKVSRSDYQITELSEILHQLVHNLITARKNFELASMEKRKLAMQMLQQQINPHFLLNTLSTIRYIADSASQPRVSSLVLSLSFLLQQQLYRDQAYWTLREEKEYLLRYIEIQNARFGDGIKVDILFEDELMERSILRMILQPLIENSFEHAFAGRSHGWIQVAAIYKGQGMEIVVRDNGNGMDVQPLSKSKKSIGLTNVKDRLLLHYGDASYLEIKSIRSEGTSVYLFIPSSGDDLS